MSPRDPKDGQARNARESGDATHGGNGEGSGSALEAMLKKRQMGVRPPSEVAASPEPQQQGGRKGKE